MICVYVYIYTCTNTLYTHVQTHVHSYRHMYIRALKILTYTHTTIYMDTCRGLEDYGMRIRRPMDLGTVLEKLKADHYRNPHMCRCDVIQVPMPYTPHPTPHTLHFTPSTPHHTPHTLHHTPPTPYTLHPLPHTLHPTPCTLHPTPAPYSVRHNLYTLLSTSYTYTLHPTTRALRHTPAYGPRSWHSGAAGGVRLQVVCQLLHRERGREKVCVRVYVCV